MAGEDPATAALWALHRDRLARQVERFVPAAPAPGMAWRDPRALRFARPAGGDRRRAGRRAGALRPGRRRVRLARRRERGGDGAARRLDRPARLRRQAADPARSRRQPRPVAEDRRAGRLGRWWCAPTPACSRRASRARIAPVAGDKPADKCAPRPHPPPRPARRPKSAGRSPATARSSFRRDGATLGRFEIEATPLGAPTVTLLEPPRANLSGSLTLHYSLADRYGIAGAEAEFANPAAGGRAAALARSAAEADAAPAQHGRTEPAKRRTTGDLSEHPWAGAQVVMTSEGDRRLRAGRRRRADDDHAAAARVPQPARARAGRTAARARSSTPTTSRRESPRRSTR